MNSLPRILIADDTLDLLKAHVLALTLPPRIANVVQVDDGAAAIAAYESAKADGAPFDLLILDLAMPHINGFMVAEEIRELGDCETRIVFFTNYDKDPENELRARACGACAIWSKLKRTNFREDVLQLLATPKPEFQKDKPDPLAPSPALAPDPALVVAKTAIKRENGFKFVGWLILLALSANIGLTLFNMARAPRVYSAISSIDKKLDGAVSTSQLPAGYRVFVPAPKSAFDLMADGSARVTFQFEPKDAAAAASLAQERGLPLQLSVTREK